MEKLIAVLFCLSYCGVGIYGHLAPRERTSIRIDASDPAPGPEVPRYHLNEKVCLSSDSSLCWEKVVVPESQ
jgi:hypothetical protein